MSQPHVLATRALILNTPEQMQMLLSRHLRPIAEAVLCRSNKHCWDRPRFLH